MSPDKKTVFIFDDEIDFLFITKLYLNKEGYNVETASKGDEGLGKIKDRDPDIILLDWRLPDQTGEDVCRKIRGDLDMNDVPIIICTADEISSDTLSAIGASGLLMKPYERVDLIETIKQYLPV